MVTFVVKISGEIKRSGHTKEEQIMARHGENIRKRNDGRWERDRGFFEYEFLEEDGTVNVLLAIDRKKQTIEAMQGILKASRDKNFFRNYLEETNCEYIDFYNYGFKEQSLLSAGFIERTEGDANIIPNYFHPFVQENIDIWIQPIDGVIY